MKQRKKLFKWVSLLLISIMLLASCKSNSTTVESMIDDSSKTESDKEIEEKDTDDVEPVVLRFDESLPSLYKEYEDYFSIGVAVPLTFYGDENINGLILKHFNSITAENAMKPEGMLNAGNKEKVNFIAADMYSQYAMDNDIGLRGHTLIWHSQTPEWFYRENMNDGEPIVTREVMLLRMENYIKEVCERYNDTNLYAWDVANEVIDISTEDNFRESLWYKIVGPDFVEKAFEYARKYTEGTDIKLYYNDYNVVSSEEKRMAIYEMAKGLAEKGLIDGVGFQGHINYSGPSAREFEETIELFESIGLEVSVTELDISLYASTDDPFNGPSDFEQRLIQQAYLYKDLFEVFKEHSDTVANVTVWALKDDQSWLNNWPVKRTNWPVLFDKDYQAKYAFYGLVTPEELPVYNNTVIIEKESVDMDNPETGFNNKVPMTMSVDGEDLFKTYVSWDDENLYFKSEILYENIGDEDGIIYQLDIENDKSEKPNEDDISILIQRDGQVWINDNQVTGDGLTGIKGADTEKGILSVKIDERETGLVVYVQLNSDDMDLRYKKLLGFDMVILNNGLDYHFHDTFSSEMNVPRNFAIMELDTARKATTAINGRPTVDGEIEDMWNEANAIVVNSYTQNSQGATAVTKTMWDDDYLYVLTIVDDIKLQALNENSYEQDSIEVFIDENAKRTNVYQEDDVQYRVNFKNDLSVNGPSDEAIVTATKISETGYVVEMAIPFLTNYVKTGSVLGFDIQINDDQGSGFRDSIANWNDMSGEGWMSTRGYGTLILE